MSFISFEFAIFFPTVVLLFYLVPKPWRWLVLLAASFFFYGSWMPVFLVLLIFKSVATYGFALGMDAAPTEALRKRWLAVSLAVIFAPLFFFKYFNFLNREISGLLYLEPNRFLFGDPDIILPIGISFFTFQAVSYVIDVYRRARPVERHFGTFALYVSFFPQLVAGPIERSTHLLYEIAALRDRYQSARFDFDPDRTINGLRLVLWGVFKKVVIADNLAIVVNEVYSAPMAHNGLILLLATYCFAYQIYCDFSGYTDIARGTSRVFGIELILNFDRPYQSRSIQEFWRRWHISLTTWFRDYVYIPMGGNRVSTAHWLLNVLVVFILSGIWHGANWTFVAWGTVHGLTYAAAMITLPVRHEIVHRLRLDLLPPPLRGAVQWLVTFHVVILGWVFFRAATLADAWFITERIVRDTPAELGRLTSLLFDKSQPTNLLTAAQAMQIPYTQLHMIWNGGMLIVLVSVLLMEIAEWVASREQKAMAFDGLPTWVRWSIYYLLATTIWIAAPLGTQQFIYFQF